MGRGFTLAELKHAGVAVKNARTIGISVDHRRTSTSQEQLDMNVNRLKSYLSKLILFPKRDAKPKKGFMADATADKLKQVASMSQSKGITMPIQKKESALEYAAITDADKKKKVFHQLRTIRTHKHYNGRRIKKSADAKKAKE